MSRKVVRRATHSGSWYTDNGARLNGQLSSWLQAAEASHSPARAVIAPHAGYDYCGACGGFAYKQVDPTNIKRVFILGPSHHVRLSKCALSTTQEYETPLYNLPLDEQVYSELYGTGKFDQMSLDTDEAEHSIEMHLPYVAKVMESRRGDFTIVPVLVGSLSSSAEATYGQLFSSYLADPSNLFVISSDFCHWGARFHYQHYEKSWGAKIYQSIEHLDKLGMDLIAALDTKGFGDYLREYGNTICGRHPIGVFLNAVDCLRKTNGHQFSMKFVQYAQSSRCTSNRDSSVSYASASLVIR